MEIAHELLKQASIIVCTVDRQPDLEECLGSLRHFRTAGAEVIVVNNGPHLAAVEGIAKQLDAKVVTEPRRGVSRARNAGISAAQGKILAFLDDDSVADPDWLPHLLSPLQDPKVLAVVGSILPRALHNPVSNAFDYLHRAEFPESQVIFDGSMERGTFPVRSALVGNANMAIRREAFERFGSFDTRLGRGTRIGSGEEPDLLLRILLGGAKIAVEPTARILHRHSTEWRAVRRWAFQSGCAHTAIITKYFLSASPLRREILRYATSRVWRRGLARGASAGKPTAIRIPLLLGSLYGPIAFLLSPRE